MASRIDTLAIAALVTGPLAITLLTLPFGRPPAPAPREVVAAMPAAVTPPACPEATPEPVSEPEREPEPEPAIEPAPAPEPDRLGARLLVVDDEVVLASQVDLAWATGPIHSAYRDWHFTAWQAVDVARLPPEIAALAGARVVVYDGEGGSCEAIVGAPRLAVEVAGDVFPDEHPGARARRDEAEARMAAPAGLVADLVAPSPCTGLWARLAELPPPVRYRPTALRGRELRALRPAILAELRLQPEYRALRRDHNDYLVAVFDAPDDAPAKWRRFVADHLAVIRWDEVDGARSFYTVALAAAPEACSNDFDGRASWILDPAGDGALRRRPGGALVEPRALFDGDGDGRVEAVQVDGFGGWTLVEDGEPAPVVLRAFEIGFEGCPC